MIDELALADAAGRPFHRSRATGCWDPIGMTNSYEQPLPKERETAAARAHNRRGARMGDPWHVYPEHAAAGLWTKPTDLAKFAIEVQNSVRGRSNRVLSQTLAREVRLGRG